MDQLRNDNPGIDFEIWAKTELLSLHHKLDMSAATSLYGPVPNANIVSELALPDLQPVIDMLKRHEVDPSEPLPPPPSPRKLEENSLSDEAEKLLRLGRRKSRLVEVYFTRTVPVESGERIAEAFRNRYRELKALKLTSDQIFNYLQKFTGFEGDLKRQAAAMAVMAYFFDECDIFDNPKEAGR